MLVLALDLKQVEEICTCGVDLNQVLRCGWGRRGKGCDLEILRPLCVVGVSQSVRGRAVANLV